MGAKTSSAIIAANTIALNLLTGTNFRFTSNGKAALSVTNDGRGSQCLSNLVLTNGTARLKQFGGQFCLNEGQTADLCLSSCRFTALNDSTFNFGLTFTNQVSQSFSASSSDAITAISDENICPTMPGVATLSSNPKLKLNGGNFGRVNGNGNYVLQGNFENLSDEQICVSSISDECGDIQVQAVKSYSASKPTYLLKSPICIPAKSTKGVCFQIGSSRSLPPGNALIAGSNGYSELIAPASRTVNLVASVNCL